MLIHRSLMGFVQSPSFIMFTIGGLTMFYLFHVSIYRHMIEKNKFLFITMYDLDYFVIDPDSRYKRTI